MKDVDVYREFAREQNLRFERVMREVTAHFDRTAARWERRAERTHNETMARFDALQEDMRELRADSRAHTQALLHVLDRLDGGGAAPAT